MWQYYYYYYYHLQMEAKQFGKIKIYSESHYNMRKLSLSLILFQKKSLTLSYTGFFRLVLNRGALFSETVKAIAIKLGKLTN